MYSNRNRRLAEGPVEPGPNVLALLLGGLAVAAVTVVTVWKVFFHP